MNSLFITEPKKNLKLMKALLYIAGEEINGSNVGISKDFHIIKHNILHFIDKANKNEWGDDLLFSYIYPSTYLDRWLSTPSLHIRAFLKVFLKCQITINWEKMHYFIFFAVISGDQVLLSPLKGLIYASMWLTSPIILLLDDLFYLQNIIVLCSTPR